MAPVRTPDGRITVPDEVIDSMHRNRIGLKGEGGGGGGGGEGGGGSRCVLRLGLIGAGPLETQVGKGAVSLNLTLRRSEVISSMAYAVSLCVCSQGVQPVC